MSVDYPGALDMLLPESYSFNSCDPLSIVIHQTGGNFTLDSIHSTFLSTMRSTHFGIGRDGQIAQFVPLVRGAGGNCCPDRDSNGGLVCDPYWYGYIQQYGNLNLCTISIEHCNDSNNSLPLTFAQLASSYQLVTWLCRRYGIKSQHIQGHNSINPVNKPNCPGNYDLGALRRYVDTQGRNPHMDQQAKDVWVMFLEGIGQPAVPYTTGIAQSWQQNYHKFNAGSPLGPEKRSVDWNGASIQIQYFTGGIRCEWNNSSNTAAWYDYNDRRVA